MLAGRQILAGAGVYNRCRRFQPIFSPKFELKCLRCNQNKLDTSWIPTHSERIEAASSYVVAIRMMIRALTMVFSDRISNETVIFPFKLYCRSALTSRSSYCLGTALRRSQLTTVPTALK